MTLHSITKQQMEMLWAKSKTGNIYQISKSPKSYQDWLYCTCVSTCQQLLLRTNVPTCLNKKRPKEQVTNSVPISVNVNMKKAVEFIWDQGTTASLPVDAGIVDHG